MKTVQGKNEETELNDNVTQTRLLLSSSVSKLREAVRRSVAEIRNIVMRGGFMTLESSVEWKTPSFKLLVFVSSTFTDTQLERNYLMDDLLFKLRTEARQHGIEVIFMDMRWGVRDENTLDHKTWEECGTGIYWCKKESLGICFVSLQADKYGYTPLPRTVLKTSLVSRLESSECDEETKKLLAHWYILDENACPVEYILRPLESTGDPAYWSAFDKMLNVLRGLEFDTEKHAGLSVGRSVSEWEVRAALGPYPVEVVDRSRSFLWSQRPVLAIDDPNSKGLGGFNDTIGNPLKEKYLDELKRFMNDEIPAETSVIMYKTGLSLTDLCVSPSASNSDQRQRYLDEFKESMSSRLQQSLHLVISQQGLWAKDGSGLGLSGDFLSEILHHSQWAHTKCQTFFGREHLIEQTIRLINASHRIEEDVGDKAMHVNRFRGIAVSLVGVSGAGKTALMAKTASTLYLCEGQEVKSRVVLVRFCGTSPGSRSARSLMISLIVQIEYLFGVEDRYSRKLLFIDDYEEVVTYFHRLLKEHPLLLFIDSLDQLTDQDLGRSEISFLKNVDPHPDTRIIVSCLPDELEVEENQAPTTEINQKKYSENKYLYLCETRLREAEVPRVSVQMSSNGIKAKEEVLGIIRHLLSQQGRTLTDSQWTFVGDRVMEETERTALYINLAVRVVSQWTSETDPSEGEGLAGGVRPLVLQLFRTFEREYGQLLVQKALGFITFSVKGVTDTEMEDLLSLDEEVLGFVFQYAQRSIRRLPAHVWLRLKGALHGLMVEGEGCCQGWYHRQLRETAEIHLNAMKINSHATMAHYFGNLVSPETLEEKKLFEHRWVLSAHESAFEMGVVYNCRRCEEASHHLMECGMLEEAEKELCSLEGIFSKIQTGMSFQLIDDLVEVEELLEKSGALPKSEKRVNHYYRWLRRDIYKIQKDVHANFLLTAMKQPLSSSVYLDNTRFLDELIKNPKKPLQVTRCISMGKPPNDFNFLVASLGGHKDSVFSVAVSHDGSQIVSGSRDKSLKLWNSKTGSLLKTLEGHSDWVNSVAFNHDGRLVASGSNDFLVKIWSIRTGSLLKTLEGHKNDVNVVVFSHDGIQILSGSEDKTIKLWDFVVGSELLTMIGHTLAVTSVAFNHDGSQIISGSHDCHIKIWDSTIGSLLMTLEGHSDIVESVAFNHDSSQIVSGSRDKSIIIWDGKSGSKVRSWEGHDSFIYSVIFNRDGSKLVSGSRDESIKIWESGTGTLLKTLIGHNLAVNSVALNHDESQIVSGSRDETIKIWDSRIGTVVNTLDDHNDDVNSVAFNHDGSQVGSGSADSTIKIWESETGSLLKTLIGHSDFVKSIAFNHDGSRILSGSDDKLVKIWDNATGSVLHTLEGHNLSVNSVAFNYEGSQIVSGSADTFIKIWDSITGSLLLTLEGHSDDVESVTFIHDGSKIISGSRDKYIIIWNVKAGSILRKLEGHEGSVVAVALNQDESLIASGSNDKSIKIWDSMTGFVIKSLDGHKSAVVSVAFNHDGSQIVSASKDKSMKIWGSTDGLLLKTLEGHGHAVTSVAFRHDGTQLVSGSRDQSIMIWFL